MLREWSPQKGHCTVTAAQRRAQCQQGKSWLLEPLLPRRAGVSRHPGNKEVLCRAAPRKPLATFLLTPLCCLDANTHARVPHSQTFTPLFANLMTCTHPCTSLKTLLGSHSLWESSRHNPNPRPGADSNAKGQRAGTREHPQKKRI